MNRHSTPPPVLTLKNTILQSRCQAARLEAIRQPASDELAQRE
jgi:hypothetical protein